MGLLERALSVEQVSKEGKESPSSLLKRASILRKQAEESPEKKKPFPLNLPPYPIE
jgi:hypothetical protein